MTIAGGRTWSVELAWDAASEVAAVAYGVPAGAIRAASRGRGPRPPKAVWEAKKIAVYLVVVLVDCDFAALGRHLALHRDTVASHCAAMREACAADDDTEARLESLRGLCLSRLQILAQRPAGPAQPGDEGLAARVASLETTLRALLAPAARRMKRLHPTISDDHENVIELAARAS